MSIDWYVTSFRCHLHLTMNVYQADSMKLWRMICSNKLLASVDLILLLNKIDILDAQLKAGVQFNKYVTSYKDKPNETGEVSKCMSSLAFSRVEVDSSSVLSVDLLDMFTSLHKQHSLKKRKMHPHLTCAIVSPVLSCSGFLFPT